MKTASPDRRSAQRADPPVAAAIVTFTIASAKPLRPSGGLITVSPITNAAGLGRQVTVGYTIDTRRSNFCI